jgi:hypothetical protein
MRRCVCLGSRDDGTRLVACGRGAAVGRAGHVRAKVRPRPAISRAPSGALGFSGVGEAGGSTGTGGVGVSRRHMKCPSATRRDDKWGVW